MSLLVVDDDADLLAVIVFALRQAGLMVETANDFRSAMTMFNDNVPDLAVLDINLPGGSGFELCEYMRKRSALPILMLTARSEESDLVRALELGADDYLVKPFSPRTLVARIRALLRRANRDGQVAAPARQGAISLDLDRLEVRIGEHSMRVTPLESRLLEMLLAAAGQVVRTERLLTHIWGHRGGGDRQLLKQLVHRLRQKIGDNTDTPRWLHTVPNVGYRLDS